MLVLRLMPLLLALPLSSPAQAWLSAQGEGTVSLLYQNNIDRLHTFSDSRTKDRGHVYFDAAIVNTDFSLTDRIAVTVSLPFVAGKYVGPFPHLLVRGLPNTAIAVDNGSFHSGFQDFRINVRYALTRGSLKVTPLFQAVQPSNNYASFGHATIGFNEREYRVGVNVGRRLDPFLPKAYVQGQYAFGFSPVIAANIAPKRSYGELQLGYLLTRHISIQSSGVLTWSHNGIENDYNLFPNNLTNEQYLNHDRVSEGRLLDIGGSISYQVNRSTNLFLSAGHSIYGRNGHLRYLVTTVGFTRAFSTRRAREEANECGALPDSSKATLCTCPKSK